MKIVKGIKIQGTNPKKFAAMYYKTEPFVKGIGSYQHTNNWEILKACEIIAASGYEIDLIDRSNKNWIPDKKYDIFLGLGVGNSGDQFVKYSKASNAKKRVLLAMGPQPDESNKRVLERYKMFHERTGVHAPPMRTVSKVTGKNFEEIIENTDYILCIGEKNTKSHNSFLKYNLPVLSFYPGISNKVNFDKSWLLSRQRNHFLCFAGNGLICKGVDLALESFIGKKDRFLHICGPPESSFVNHYRDVITNSKNIFYHGFIEPGGNKFNELAKKCSYVIFHSSAEGCCTSVATAMRAGLVPVINSWTGINITKDNGILISEEGDIIQNISDKVDYALKIPQPEYNLLCEKSLENIKNYSQDGFLKSYKASFDFILNN